MAIPTDEELEKLTKFFADVQASAFSQAIIFTNVITAAGYAGAFALWNMVRGQLPPAASLWVVISLGISLLVFIAWNVFQMIWFAIERLSYFTPCKGSQAWQ
jgi:hypothetical protein